MNKQANKDILLFRVLMDYEFPNELNATQVFYENFRFSIWRTRYNASSCECRSILDTYKKMTTSDKKECIIAVIPSELSQSFEVGEELIWGAGLSRIGKLVILEKLNSVEMPTRIVSESEVALYRPVNQQELDLIIESGFSVFPPRLPEQPIFYPVLNRDYAHKINKEWNVPAYGVGYITRFRIDKNYLSKFEVQNVGGIEFEEYWIPSENLEEFNSKIIGLIEIIEEVR